MQFHKFSQLFFFERRFVYVDKPSEGASVEQKKETPKEGEKKPATYSVDDLKRSRTEAEKKLSQSIKHPEVQEEAKKDLAGKLDPLEKKLATLDAEKQDEQMKLKQDVDKAVTEVLDAKREFSKMLVQYKGRNFEFAVNPALGVDQYESLMVKAQNSLVAFDTLFRPNGTYETPPQLINGEVVCKVNLARETVVNGVKQPIPGLPEGAYKDVTIAGLQIIERYSDPNLDQKISAAAEFQAAFEQWKSSPNANFNYGDPPRVFPPQGFDMTKFLSERMMAKTDLKMDHLMDLRMPDLVEIDQPQKIQTYSYEKKGNVLHLVTATTETMHQLSPASESIEKGPDYIRTRKVEYRIVNQQRRKIEVVTDYWPQAPGSKEDFKLKKIEEIEDGIVTSKSSFDKQGKLLERTSMVKGCNDAQTVERPIGPPYKEMPALDDHGKPILDAQGKPVMDRVTSREFVMKDEKGKETGKVRAFAEENAYRKKMGQKPLNEMEYYSLLGKNLQSPERMHAFIMTMFEYRYDDAGKDTWQRSIDTLNRTRNGAFLGDCEDYAFVLQKILEAQGKKPMVISLPGHAEVVTISRDEKGDYHAVSYGTFGVDVDGNRVGEEKGSKKNESFKRPHEAILSLQKKWSFKENGNPEMEDGNPFYEYQKSKQFSGAIGVMSFEPENSRGFYTSISEIPKLQFDENGFPKGQESSHYRRSPDGVITDQYGNKFKLSIDGAVKDEKGNTFRQMSNGRVEDQNGNRYELLGGGRVGKYSPVKLDDNVLSPHSESKVVAATGDAKTDVKKTEVKPASPVAKAVESPEVREAKTKVQDAARSVFVKYVQMPYAELAKIDNLGARISSELVSATGAVSSDKVNVYVPLLKGLVTVQVNKGKVSVNGTDAYAQKILANKKKTEEEAAA